MPFSSQPVWEVHPASERVQRNGEDAKEKGNKMRRAEAEGGALETHVDGRKDPTLTTLEVKRTQWTQEKGDERSVLPCRGDRNGSKIYLTCGIVENGSASLTSEASREREREREQERERERQACGIPWGTTGRGLRFKVSNAVGIASVHHFYCRLAPCVFLSFSPNSLPRFNVLYRRVSALCSAVIFPVFLPFMAACLLVGEDDFVIVHRGKCSSRPRHSFRLWHNSTVTLID